MAKEKVKVKLFDNSYVGGKLRQKGETVEVAAEVANEFGEPIVNVKDFGDGLLVREDDTVASLEKRYGKPELVELAKRAKADSTADNNKTEIATKILEAVRAK